MRLTALVAGALAFATPAGAFAGSVSPSPALAATEGTLTAKDGKDTVPVPLEHTKVDIHVHGNLADVDVTQTFHNPYQDKIEATYLFPLPTGAAVNAMDLVSDGKTIVGRVMLKGDAQAVYDVAKQDGHVAALLTEQRPNLFTQAVANLEPGAKVLVHLHYVEALPYSDGAHELVFPMVAGPRFVPKTSKLRPEDVAAISAPVLPAGLRPGHDVEVNVDLATGLADVPALTSPSHKIVIAAAPGAAQLHLDPSDTVPNKDFVLRWSVAGAQPAFAVLADRHGDARGSFFLLAEPPRVETAEITPRELVFVVDTSSSMAGAPLAKAKEIVHRALTGLGADDTFQIVRFDDSASALGPRLLANKERNVTLALGWLDALVASGGTDLATGIDGALGLPHDPARLRVVVFLTDGYIGNEDEILADVAQKRGEARIFAVGIGSAVNRYLLEGLASEGRGAAQIIRADEDGGAAVDAFYRRIDRPVLTDLRVDWNGLAVEDVTPAPGALPDLFAGQPLVISGRYARAGAATVVVTGKSGGRDVRFEVPVALPEAADSPGVALVWARARVAELERQELRGERPELKAQIVGLALANRMLTRYTAFVAVDTSRKTKPGKLETVPVPLDVPDGVDRNGHIGGGIGSGGDTSMSGEMAIGSYGTIGHGSGTGYGYGNGSGIGPGGGGSTGIATKSEGQYEMAHAAKEPTAQPSAPPPPVATVLASPTPGDSMGMDLDEGKMGRRLADDERAPVAAAQHDLQVCYAAAVTRSPELADSAGPARVVIDLDAKGTVTSVKFALVSENDGLRACIETASKSWHFGGAHNGWTISVVFSAAAAAKEGN